MSATVNLCPTFGVGYQAFSAVGLPLNAGLIYTYAAGGTSTAQATYTTSAGSTPNANPIVLGTDGRPPYEIWLTSGLSYCFVLTDSLGSTIATWDNINNVADIATTTVASHATTGDIWTPKGDIDWTGTATTTAFPSAPVAGARRLLVCAGACKFTAGANLLIEGIQSGATVTMKANALVWVNAITTTQFKLTWSLTGSFTATGTGFSSNPSVTWYYSVNNGIVHISPQNHTMTGTSNATTFTITGFPAEITPGEANPNDSRLFLNLVGQDNGSYVYTFYGVINSTSVMSLYPTPAGGSWTSVGTKLLVSQELQYSL